MYLKMLARGEIYIHFGLKKLRAKLKKRKLKEKKNFSSVSSLF